LLDTCAEVQAPEIWITHGREEALIHALGQRGQRGRALHLVGLGEDEDEPAAERLEEQAPEQAGEAA
jgi:putative mRNA 3-end processing factor